MYFGEEELDDSINYVCFNCNKLKFDLPRERKKFYSRLRLISILFFVSWFVVEGYVLLQVLNLKQYLGW